MSFFITFMALWACLYDFRVFLCLPFSVLWCAKCVALCLHMMPYDAWFGWQLLPMLYCCFVLYMLPMIVVVVWHMMPMTMCCSVFTDDAHDACFFVDNWCQCYFAALSYIWCQWIFVAVWQMMPMMISCLLSDHAYGALLVFHTMTKTICWSAYNANASLSSAE